MPTGFHLWGLSSNSAFCAVIKSQVGLCVLAWRIPGTGELGGLPSMGLHRVGHGTLIPSAQRLVWAAKQPLGNAALGALFA